MRAWSLALLALSFLTAGCIEGVFDSPEPDPEALALLEDLSTFPEWRMETDHGAIRMLLYTEWLPTTTEHLSRLTEEGFYDDTIIHRVVDDFVIQGGDATCTSLGGVSVCTGEGGSGPGGTSEDIPLEISDDPVLDFGTGAVGLARWTDDTGDSQYFITEKPAIHLSRPDENGTGAVFGAYSLFAQVFDGMDVVRAIAEVETDANDKPTTDVLLHNATVLPPPTDVDLLNLIPDVHADVSTQGYGGDLEVPRIIVTDHAAIIRFTTDSAEGPCTLTEFRITGHESAAGYYDWTADDVDPCTFMQRITFEEPGAYVVDLGVDEIPITVLPWHDAYAPFTGTAI